MSSAPPIEVCRRSEAERPALEAMYVDVFGKQAAEESRARWRWQYDENPNCPPEGPEIWVAKEDGRVLGQYATMPVRLKVLDRILGASWGMDVMVGPNLQRKGIGSRLFLYWDQQVEASLGLGLSLSSYTLFKKLNWEDVGPVPCFSAVVDMATLLERRLGKNLVTSAVLAPLAKLFMWLVFPRRRTRNGKLVEVRRAAEPFGADYDSLWERVAPAYDFIAERKAHYLEWKYRKVPHVSYDIFEALKDGVLTGYIVLRATERNGVKLALVVDLLAEPEDKATLGSLLDHAFVWAREHDAARLQTFTFDRRLQARLANKGFIRIESPMQFCVRIHSDHVDELFFRDTSRWHVSFGDSDQDRQA
jgi:GNAT superfamily N-acetyltransferase